MAIINGTVNNDTLTGGADDDLIFGLAGNDSLAGDLGDDLLDGGAGNDTMRGGEGDDAYFVSASTDAIIEEDSGGYDVVFAAASFVLSSHVEDLILGTGAINGTGSALDNVLIGNAMANVLDGAGGADEMAAGLGNDTYVVDNADDAVQELAGEGIDLVRSSFDGYVLPVDLENLTLFGTAVGGTGNAVANVLTGSEIGNALFGAAGADRLLGLGGDDYLDGGSGNDTAEGGLGDDTYVVDVAGDSLVEALASGIDTVRVTRSYTLGLNLENLVILAGAFDGTGNTANNQLTGSGENNVLAGLAGADSLDGGDPEDDPEDEEVFTDSDTASYAASAAGVIVSLVSGTGVGGDAQGDVLMRIENLTGSAFNDILTGNDGDNILDGGLGSDVMSGGLGRDTYIVNSTGDVIVDSGGDADRVESSVTYRIASGVELLFLTGGAAIDGIGNRVDNLIMGNSAANMLVGLSGDDFLLGGAGSDLLLGGSGADALSGGSGADRLMGGSGSDTALYAGSPVGVSVSLTSKTGTGGHAEGDRLSSIENLEGSSFNDTLLGSAGDNQLDGGQGGDNSIRGGDGNDSLFGSSQMPLDEEDPESPLVGGNDRMVAGVGNDFLDGRTGADTMYGGQGDDAYYVSDANQVVAEFPLEGDFEEDEIDQELFGDGNDTVFSAVDDYTLPSDIETLVLEDVGDINGTGNEADNTLIGNLFNNVLDGGGGFDTLIGGQGDDTYAYAGAFPVEIQEFEDEGFDAVASLADFDLSPIANVEYLILEEGSGATFGQGNGLDNFIDGNSNNNFLSGGDGNDFLTGFEGDDTLQGGTGDDILDGQDGSDAASYEASSERVVVNLAFGAVEAGGDGGTGDEILLNIENVIGSSFDDSLSGDLGDNLLEGRGGNDTLSGSFFDAGTGNDTLLGDSGNDSMVGWDGDDLLNGGDDDDTLEGGAGADTLVGDAGVDTVTYENSSTGVGVSLDGATVPGSDAQGDAFLGVENLIGSQYGDWLRADAEANLLSGGGGDDTLEGRAGGDSLQGGEGIDAADYAASPSAIEIDLFTLDFLGGDAEGDVLGGIEIVFGSEGNDALRGDEFANFLFGGDGNDTLEGRAGADQLGGNGGNDAVSYASSASAVTIDLSTLTASGGDAEGDILNQIEDLIGSANDDVLTGSGEENFIDGGAGNDTLAGLLFADTIDGGDGVDTVTYAYAESGVTVMLFASVAQSGESDGDLLSGIENVIGTALDDNLSGDEVANKLEGGAGNDNFEGEEGDDTLDGGAGIFDYANYASAGSGVSVDLVAGSASGAGTDLLIGIENLSGSSHDDFLAGDGNQNTIFGRDGNDTLRGGGGDDALFGEEGIDTADYSTEAGAVSVDLSLGTASGSTAGSDTLTGIENATGSGSDDTLTGDGNQNSLQGGAGNDTLEGLAGLDNLVGGEGIDTATYASSGSAVTVHLATGSGSGGDAAGDSLSEIENLIGSTLGDWLTGDGAGNRLEGGTGFDLLEGRGGADTIIGGTELDSASYENSPFAVTIAGNSSADGGDATGDDLEEIEIIRGSEFNDSLSGDALVYQLLGFGGSDTLTGTADANDLHGGTGDDLLEGGAGGDIIDGGDGPDTASYATSAGGVAVNLSSSAASGADAQGDIISGIENLIGSASDDTLTGSDGANMLDGRGGSDSLTGGAGADRFVFSTAPTVSDGIVDFASGVDLFQFENAAFTEFAGTGILTADEFQAGATGAINDTSGSATVRVKYNTDTGFLYYDANGSDADGLALVAILTGQPTVTFSDIEVI